MGTGLRKCIPITLLALEVWSAIFDKLNVEVFDINIVSGGAIVSSSLNIFTFNSKSSSTASIINSHSETLLRLAPHFIRLDIALFSLAVIAQRLIS